MTRRVKVALSAAMLPIAVIVGVNTIFYRPFKSPTQRAYRLCRECADLSPAEVDDQINMVRSETGTREDKLRLFYDQFDDRADAEYCEPCAEAILDASESKDQP